MPFLGGALFLLLVLILAVQRCDGNHYRGGDVSYSGRHRDDGSRRLDRVSRGRTGRNADGLSRQRSSRRGTHFVGRKKPLVSGKKTKMEYHYPYRPKFQSHPSFGGMCRLGDFTYDPRRDRLGKGGFGEVFVARHKNGRIVAIKRTPAKSIMEKPKHVENEETIQRILDHPNISELLCTMRDENNDIYFVFEYFHNGNLLKQLSALYPLPRSLMAKYVAQIILAFRYMHSFCILYRDLKAENIMIDAFDNVKLVDFGLSVYDCEGKQTSFAGTLEYVAPEVAGRQRYGREVDYWSLGVLIYLLQTKSLPYKRGREMSRGEFTKKLAKGQFKIPPTGDAQVDELIDLLVLPDQEERWKRVHEEFDKIKRLPFFATVDWDSLEGSV